MQERHRSSCMLQDWSTGLFGCRVHCSSRRGKKDPTGSSEMIRPSPCRPESLGEASHPHLAELQGMGHCPSGSGKQSIEPKRIILEL